MRRNTDKALKVISLGWGVQSFTLAVMSALGDIEPVDYAIHADTAHERTATYEFAERWTPWLEEYGVRVVTVINSKPELIDKYGGMMIPAYTIGDDILGQVRRQCTSAWKVKQIRRWLQSDRNGEPVEMWLGISLDEVQRMKESDVKYITHRWPLIEHKMSRHDCKMYLEKNGIEIPGRSACVFCPYQSRTEWRHLKENAPQDWEKAVAVDEQIRKALPPYDLFVNVQRKPLEYCDLTNQMDAGQLELWENECEGYCGV